MRQFIKSLEIRYNEYRFDGSAWNYELNIFGVWVPVTKVCTSYAEAIKIMRSGKAQIANGMSPMIATRIISVETHINYDVCNKKDIDPNSKWARHLRRLQKKQRTIEFDDDVIEF